MSADLQGRYARQMALPGFGEQAQRRLEESAVLVVGAGGLGAPVLTYLAGAGVGRIGIADGDRVSAGNLNRQFLFEERDIGHSKALCAARRLRRLNSSIRITPHPEALTAETAADTLSGYRLALLCLDSIAARKLVNRAAVALGIPCVEGAVAGRQGSMFCYLPGQTACYECLARHVQGGAQQVPVLGAMAGVVGSHMALAAIDILLQGAQAPALGRLVTFNGATHESASLPVERDSCCPVCGAV